MGNETSKSSLQTRKKETRIRQIVEKIKQIDDPEIQKILPLITFDQNNREILPSDINIKPEYVEDAYILLKQYLDILSEEVEENQCKLFLKMEKQLAQFCKIDGAFENRCNKYSDFMKSTSVMFSDIRNNINKSVDALNRAIERADELAREISDDMPTFKEFSV